MTLNKYGQHIPDLANTPLSTLVSADQICPFSDTAANETVIGSELFAEHKLNFHSQLGHYATLYTGRIENNEKVRNSSSGGLTTWLARELLTLGRIDAVIHVGEMFPVKEQLVQYTVSESLTQLDSRTKSRYHTSEFSDLLLNIRGNGKRYLFIGVPCFVKALRLLCRSDEILKEQICFVAALVCGHLKTPAFAQLLAWQMNIPPGQLTRFDYRVKDPAKTASRYSVKAWGSRGLDPIAQPAFQLFGSNWGHAFFQLKACDACDDVMGELADITFGDAWLPKFEEDWMGTNIVICRSIELNEILENGRSRGEILLEDSNSEDVISSQLGNYRHRWDGLSVRALDAKKNGIGFPKKRIGAGTIQVPFLRKKIIRLRQKIAHTSHEAFYQAKQVEDLEIFYNAVTPLIHQMKRLHEWSYRISGERILFYLKRPDKFLWRGLNVIWKISFQKLLR